MKTERNHKHTNQLIAETSPYLLQHAHNPVDWYPWCDEAFDKAKRENKLVLVSIGYAACHWCHVMEHESFENEEIANIMNEKYVCIKVDREERPDVDNLYMTAVQMITGSGGWPLNCFVLPDRRPIYGGTYFSANEWENVLVGLNSTYTNEPEKIMKAADEIMQGISQASLIPKQPMIEKLPVSDLHAGITQWESTFDETWGGSDRAPKFPMPVGLAFMNQYQYYFNSDLMNAQLHKTLVRMAQGGIYDQVGGGFSRYSVDKYWKVPHFEKMLYDNAQLISVYSDAYRQKKDTLYSKIVQESIAFVERELTADNGGVYASYDADSEGVEGKFYVWSKRELESLLSKNEKWVLAYYNMEEQGNWEEGNILWITDHEKVMKEQEWSNEVLYAQLKIINNKLLKHRSKRIYPALDNKILTEWNALMGLAYIDAFLALNDKQYLEKAHVIAGFMESEMITKSGVVLRNFTDGKASIDGVLSDYALLIRFFIRLYQTSMNQHYLELAEQLFLKSKEQFFDSNSGMFFYSSVKSQDIINRSIETSDNVIPSSNAVMAHNLLDLSILLGKEAYRDMSYQMLLNVSSQVQQNTAYFAHWASLWLRYSLPTYEVVICGENADLLMSEFSAHYLPNTIVIGSKLPNEDLPYFKNRWVDGKTLIYVCVNNTCKLPVGNLDEALRLIKINR